jgi:hypothetical protein
MLLLLLDLEQSLDGYVATAEVASWLMSLDAGSIFLMTLSIRIQY